MSFKFIKNLVEGVKKLDGEVNDYKKVVKNPYLPSLAYVNWALHLVQTGDREQAEEKLLSSTLMGHQTPEAYINLGVLRTKEKKFDEAKELYIKALRLDNNNAKAFCFLGNVLTEMKNYEDAERNFARAIKLDPNNADIKINWGISLVRQRKFPQAKEKFEQACKLNTANFTALYFLGLVDLELGDLDKAKDKFKMIVSVTPNNHEAFYYLAYVAYKQCQYQESLDYALTSLELFNKKAETYMLIAENYMNLENGEECFKYYELGSQECKINYFFYISWGISLQHFEKYEESKEKFNKAIEIDDRSELAFVYLGTSYLKLKDYNEAKKLFERTLEINPENISAINNIGQIFFEWTNYNEAINYYEKALKISAKVVENYEKIAKAYEAGGNIQKAKEYFQKACEYNPDEINVLINYSKFLISRQDWDSALKKLQGAYKLDDKNLDCLNLLFYVNYMLAKENLSDYNVEKAMTVADEIQKYYPSEFAYAKEKEELESRIAGKKKNS